jgi:membrane protease YdiL (CAAX protease family)
MDAQVMLVGYFLYCGTLLLLIVASSYFVVSLGEVFRFDKMPVLQAVRRDLFFDVRGRRWYLRRVSLSMGGGTRNRISRTLWPSFEQSKSDAQRVPMFPATVIAAPGAEEQVFRGYL